MTQDAARANWRCGHWARRRVGMHGTFDSYWYGPTPPEEGGKTYLWRLVEPLPLVEGREVVNVTTDHAGKVQVWSLCLVRPEDEPQGRNLASWTAWSEAQRKAAS
jgi:hypothetical protein